jgi:HAD superfamily hydrolase (TIGR01509 family)
MTRSEKRPVAALFDVDGTLVDTNYLHVLAWWEALRQAGHRLPMTRIHRAIGIGGDRILDHLLPSDRDVSADDEIRAAHRALYAADWPRLTALPGAADLLRACTARGLRVVLASSASQRELDVMRDVLGAEEAIMDVTSASSVEESKPAPDLVEVALDKAGVDAAEAVFVGDTVWDVEACAKAGVPCVGLLSGGIGRDELAGAVEIYEGPADLLSRLDQSPLIGHEAQ